MYTAFSFSSYNRYFFVSSPPHQSGCHLHPNDAVARNENQNGVAVICHTYGPACLGISCHFGNFAIGPGLAIRNLP